MTILGQYIALLAVHWVADFVLQTHWQALNKSKRIDALLGHVTTYTAVLGVMTPGIFFRVDGAALLFVALNGVLHFATDYFSSRVTARLWAKGETHNFFVVVGLDQLIHQATLALTMAALLA